MKLRDLLIRVGMSNEEADKIPCADWELAAHEAGEQADEVVHIDLVPEIRHIYLEYE